MAADERHRPAQTSVDVCKYSIHFPSKSSSPEQLASHLVDVLAFTATRSSSYIWHKQPFNLSVSPAPFTLPAKDQFLEGKTECTDCVDDEWFIVWLLREVSKAWKDVVISVEDDDGEFLLIEGAEVLPRWVTPQNAENRVWISQGSLHLISLEHKSALPFERASEDPSFESEEEGFIDRATAVGLVRDPAVSTNAPQNLQDIVWARINGYPDKILEHLHKTLAYLPIEVALALSDSPGLVAEAIAAFYEREPTTLRACSTMTRFPPSSPSDAYSNATALPSTVNVPTTLTRPLYSQLILQRFFPLKPFEKVGWLRGTFDSDEERRRNVGMKIACGFEMLYKMTSPQVRVSTTLDPTEPMYKAFVARLEKNGFFEGQIQGSARWTEKESQARTAWLASKSEKSSASFAQRVDDAVSRARTSPSPLSHRVTSQLTPAAAAALEDSESWLTLDEAGLEEMLQSRGPGADGIEDLDDDMDSSDDDEDDDKMEGVESNGVAQERKADKKAKQMARQMQKMAGKVEDFVEGRGAVDGAEFSDEHSDNDDDDEDMPEMSAEERSTRLASLVSPLPENEWGQKPLAQPPVPSSADSSTLPPRGPKLTTNKYDGASSDESSDEEAEEGQQDGPSVVEKEMDMNEEMEEFLKFATETLGLSEEQYGKIIGDREQRGAYVPGPSQPKKTNVVPTPKTASVPEAVRTPAPAAPRQPLRNPNLTDFDALMEQMENELATSRASKAKPAPSSSTSRSAPPKTAKAPKAAQKNVVVESDSSDEDSEIGEMDAELAELFKSVGGDTNGGPMDYNLVKNFLESFQSQGGFGGPAGNLSGRLGFPLPKDASGSS